MNAISNNYILGLRVDPVSYHGACGLIFKKAAERESSYVCAANVHMVMEGYDSVEFRRIVNGALLVTPDGMPLYWGLRRLGARDLERVRGWTLTQRLCEEAARMGVPVGFYGGYPDALAEMLVCLRERYPDLKMVYHEASLFRPLTCEEDSEIIKRIEESGARILFVGLGCPLQERWMADHVGKIKAVMIGVGAAFNFLAGRIKEAPAWMQRAGLEWLYRLSQEPGRLWRRYLRHNPRFAALFMLQLLGVRTLPGKGRALSGM